MKVKISAERKENSGYSLKYDHDILLELRLKVSMFTEVNMGWFPIGSVTPMSDTTKKIRISLNKGNGNPVSFSFKEVTNSAGISAVNKGAERLTNGFIKVKSKMYYSLKYKILSVD